MRNPLKVWISFLFFAVAVLATAQQPSTDSRPTSLALEAASEKSKPVTAAGNSASPNSEENGVAELARRLRGQDLAKVRVSPEEARKILRSIQPVLRFASEDSGLPIHAAVKPRMISRNDLHRIMQVRKVDDEDANRLQGAELALKKFGFVPRSFSTGKFVEGMYEELLAGFYDPRTKMITLLDWVAPEAQLSVLAHELTHALQDQNFNLTAFQQAAVPAAHPAGQFHVNEGEALLESDARRSVVEGQAMVVLIDYQWKQQGIDARLEDLPGASGAASEYMAMVPAPDTPVIHASPIFLRDGMGFPYREGLVFELELLRKGGKELAFRKVFARPPLDTHEILHPEAYIQRQRIQAPQIPDLNAALADKYKVVDAGGLGELDIRSLVKQYENTWLAENIAPGWRGSSYLVVKRKEVETAKASTADVALIYVSAWSSRGVAERFAKFYADAVPKRYSQATPAVSDCQGSGCPLESFQFNTEEGLVRIECRPNNLVLVTESIDPTLAGTVNAAILKANTNARQVAQNSQDLTSRYLNSPVFGDVRALWEQTMLWEAAKAFSKK